MEKAKIHVKKGDTVVVVSGSKDHTDKKTGEFKPGIRGKTGKVKAVYPDKQMVLVEGVNLIKKAVRPTPQKPQGGFSEQEAPLHASKVRPICPSCGKPTRVRHKAIEEVIGKNADGSNKVKTRRLRICAQCEGSLDTKDNK